MLEPVEVIMQEKETGPLQVREELLNFLSTPEKLALDMMGNAYAMIPTMQLWDLIMEGNRLLLEYYMQQAKCKEDYEVLEQFASPWHAFLERFQKEMYPYRMLINQARNEEIFTWIGGID